MYRSSPFRSTLNTGYITALDMCEVCTEAVHSVAPWTRVTSQLWTSVKYEPPWDTFVHISTIFTRFYVSRTILRWHFRWACFGNSTTLPRLYLWRPANSTTLTRAPNQPGVLFLNAFWLSVCLLLLLIPWAPHDFSWFCGLCCPPSLFFLNQFGKYIPGPSILHECTLQCFQKTL